MYTFSVFGNAILIHLGRHHVAHGVVLPLPEWRKEVESTCMDTLTSNLTRILCFPNVIQLNFSVFKFHLLSSFFLWNFTKIQIFGELEVFEKSGSSLSCCRSRENHGAQHITINFLSKPQAQGGPSHLFHHLPRNLKEVCADLLLTC